MDRACRDARFVPKADIRTTLIFYKMTLCAASRGAEKLERLMRTGSLKGSLQLFGIVAVGTALFGLWQGYGIGETLIAAVILSAFIIGIAWVGARADSRFNRK